MLYTETVSRDTLELIIRLQSDKFFSEFFLVGGTALALQIGHRTSIDIDLFTRNSFDSNLTLEHLESMYDFQLQFEHTNTIKGIIDGVFTDLVRHNYPLIKSPVIINGIKMASTEDSDLHHPIVKYPLFLSKGSIR